LVERRRLWKMLGGKSFVAEPPLMEDNASTASIQAKDVISPVPSGKLQEILSEALLLLRNLLMGSSL
jgi:hypothetical protein